MTSYSMKLVLCLYLHLFTFNVSAEQYDLFILAGQSNMQGWRSDAAQYPIDIKVKDESIPFYFEALNYSSSNSHWQTLGPQLGHFQQGHFGPEVSFAHALSRANYLPAIFKYSSGSSSIKNEWKSPGHHGQYDDMVKHLKLAIHSLEAEGHSVTPRAFIWVQGESDAENQQLANEYYWHLKKMLTHLRNSVLKSPNFPIILSVDEQHPRVQIRPQVVDAQIKLSMEDDSISFVTMKGLEKYDATHLTSRGTVAQGKRLYQAYMNQIFH